GFKIIQYSLPTLLLHILRVLSFSFKSFCNQYSLVYFLKSDLHRSAVVDGILDFFVRNYSIVGATEIKTKTTILSFHACGESSTFSKVVFCPWCMPIRRS